MGFSLRVATATGMGEPGSGDSDVIDVMAGLRGRRDALGFIDFLATARSEPGTRPLAFNG
jgi:hypothetical protein